MASWASSSSLTSHPVAGTVERFPSYRGGHGVPQKIVIEELTAAGLQMEKVVTAVH